MNFTDYQYLWPPRPEKAVPKDFLSFHERRGFVAQYKKNGTCNVLAVAPDKTIHAMNRHNETHKLWTPTEASSAAFKALPGKGWYVFVAELLHSKVTDGPKDTNYINDILVADGDYLVGSTFGDRMACLNDIFADKIVDTTTSHYVINPNTYLARCHETGFYDLFNGLSKPEDEGLVLKNPKAALAYCTRASSNSGWMVKCRRPTKTYAF